MANSSIDVSGAAASIAARVGNITGSLTLRTASGAVTGGTPSGGALGSLTFTRSGTTWSNGTDKTWKNDQTGDQTVTVVRCNPTGTSYDFDFALSSSLVIPKNYTINITNWSFTIEDT